MGGARKRGRVRSGGDFVTALELLLAAINMRALYAGGPVDDDYCHTVSDLVYRAVAAV